MFDCGLMKNLSHSHLLFMLECLKGLDAKVKGSYLFFGQVISEAKVDLDDQNTRFSWDFEAKVDFPILKLL